MEPHPRLSPKAFTLLPTLAICLCTARPLQGLAQAPEYQIKAEFLERFTRFIEWPMDSTASNTHSPFVIGLYGGNPFGTYLEELTARGTIKGKPIRVQEIENTEQIQACHILFVAGPAKRQLRQVISLTEARPILTVGDTDGFAEKGVLINFYSVDNRIGFEINDSAVKRSGLKFSSKLLRLARIVNLEAAP